MHIKCVGSRQRLKGKCPKILIVVWGCLLLCLKKGFPIVSLLSEHPHFDTGPAPCVSVCANQEPTRHILPTREPSPACATWKQRNACQHWKRPKIHIHGFYWRITGFLPAPQSSDGLQVKSHGPWRQRRCWPVCQGHHHARWLSTCTHFTLICVTTRG